MDKKEKILLEIAEKMIEIIPHIKLSLGIDLSEIFLDVIAKSYDQGYSDAKKELTDSLSVVTPEEAKAKVEKLFDENRGVINEPVSKNEFFKGENFSNE